MKSYLVLIAFIATTTLASSPAQAWNLEVPSITAQSSWQSEHNKNVERDYKEVTKWQQDVGIVPKSHGPGLMEYFWPFVLAGALMAVYAVFQLVPAKFRKQAIAGTVAIVVGAIGLRIYEMEKVKADYQAEKALKLQRKNEAIAAYKTVFKKDAEPIKRLFNGDDPRFLAGEQNYEQLKKSPGAKHSSIYNSKYSELECDSRNPCIGMIFPENHPISVGLWHVKFYYCETKAKEKIFTGFGFGYNSYYDLDQYESVRAGLLDAELIAKPYILVGKDRKMTYIDSPSDYDAKTLGKGNGISIIWSKLGNKGVDLCGNNSFES